MLYCTLLVTQQQTSLSESSCKFPTFGFVQNALTKSPKKQKKLKTKKNPNQNPLMECLKKSWERENFKYFAIEFKSMYKIDHEVFF